MDLGIEKQQVEALKAWVDKTAHDPMKLRFLLSLVILGIGHFFVASPLADRVAAARKAHKSAQDKLLQAEAIVHYNDQIEAYTPRLTWEADVVSWQIYVLDKLDRAGVLLVSLEPKPPETKGPFKVVEMDVVAKADDYRSMVDFVDRLEHGERLVRLEKVIVEESKKSVLLTCIIKGLVKPGMERPPPPAPELAPTPSAEEVADG